MDPKDKVIIVTGGASGIGRSIARRFAQEGARAVVVADLHLEPAQAVAAEFGGLAVRCDVSKEADIQALVATTRERYGRVDAYISNAGILGRPGGIELEDPLWDAMWNIHGMAHVWAARAVVPEMVERGEGFFLVTASAAGLLTIVESAPYAVTKHAAVAFAEWLRIAYGRQHVARYLLGRQDAVVRGRSAVARDHGRLHRLRAQAGHAHALAAVGDAQPLGKGHGRMFGDGVGGGFDDG